VVAGLAHRAPAGEPRDESLSRALQRCVEPGAKTKKELCPRSAPYRGCAEGKGCWRKMILNQPNLDHL